MKSFCKKLVSTALAGAMLVWLIPTSALAVHTDEGSIAQSNPLADSAKIFLNSTGDNDTLLPSAYDDSRYNLPNRGLVGENQYINIIPITPEQVENVTTIDLYAQAEVTMSEFVAGVLCEESTPLDISKTKFMVFMAVSDSMTVDTDTDFLFNSTFLMPDEEAMGDGITVRVAQHPAHQRGLGRLYLHAYLQRAGPRRVQRLLIPLLPRSEVQTS